MEPLAILPSSLDWETFTPSQKGYLPPANMYIDSCDDVYDEFREYLENPSYFRMKASPIAAMASYPDPPQPGLVNSLNQSIPLHDGKPKSTKFEEYSAEDAGLQTTNDRWETFVSKKTSGPLAEMNVNLASRQTVLSSLNIHPGPMDVLLPVPKTEDTHYATAFVFLPTKSTSLEVEAAAGTTVQNLSATKDTAFSAQIVVVYAGLDLVRIKTTDSISYLTYHILAEENSWVPSLSDISPAIPGLRDAFRTWKWMLLNPDDPSAKAPDFILSLLHERFIDLSNPGPDKAVVAHLVPLAKMYGFKLLVVDVEHEMSSLHEVSHPYKEYDYFLEGNRWEKLKKKLRVENGDDLDTTVTVKVKDLNLEDVNVSEDLKQEIQDKLEHELYFSNYDEYDARDPKIDMEGYDASIYSDTFHLSHIRRANFLLLIPE